MHIFSRYFAENKALEYYTKQHAADNYCAGGPIGGAGDVVTECPAGTTTATTGSVTISQCQVAPGSYYDGSKVVTCTAGNYCPGR
jgi:hypothetical protein